MNNNNKEYQQAVKNLGGKENSTPEFGKKIAAEIAKIKSEKQSN